METHASHTFIGVDLGWYGKPTGLASLVLQHGELRLRSVARIEDPAEIIAWISAEAGSVSTVAAIDAPTVIPNEAGIREAESQLNREFRRYHAGCHAANLGRPFAANVLAFSRKLEDLGFGHGPGMEARQAGRFQIEVHPHAATVSLFRLPQIVKYKRGPRAARSAGLKRLRRLMLKHLPVDMKLPAVPAAGNLKPVEDRIDAVLCAYIAAHWWLWGRQGSRVFGDRNGGYIVVPFPVAASANAGIRS